MKFLYFTLLSKNGKPEGNMENNDVLEMLEITKEFPGVKALDSVTLKVKEGTVTDGRKRCRKINIDEMSFWNLCTGQRENTV